MLEKIVAERFSLPRDVLLVLDEDENIERLLDTEDRLNRRRLRAGAYSACERHRLHAAVRLGCRRRSDGPFWTVVCQAANVQRQVETAAETGGVSLGHVRAVLQSAATPAGF